MIHIDGTLGEGGGQVLRSSLALAMLTGQPVRLTNIRARRPKPGLQAQHLAAVQAAAAVCGAEVTGAAIGSQDLTFVPGPIQPGAYRADIGTAGSTSLVLQTVFLPLTLPSIMLSYPRHGQHAPDKNIASDWSRGFSRSPSLSIKPPEGSIPLRRHVPGKGRSPEESAAPRGAGDSSLPPVAQNDSQDQNDRQSEITLTGGTHVSWSPCTHYLTLHWLPMLRRCGCDAEIELLLGGFYPEGNGQVRATIRPVERITPLHLPERGALRGIRGISAVANLDLRIAERQRDRALTRLQGRHNRIEIELLDLPARSKGTFLLLLAEFKHGEACYVSLGAIGKRAEQVADEACLWLEKFLAGAGAVDEYLADQLLLPLAFADGESLFRTARVTEHLRTNAEVIRAFGVAEIEIEKEQGGVGLVRITPTPH